MFRIAVVIPLVFACTSPVLAQSTGPGTYKDFIGEGRDGSDSGTGSGTRSGVGTDALAMPPSDIRSTYESPNNSAAGDTKPSQPRPRPQNKNATGPAESTDGNRSQPRQP